MDTATELKQREWQGERGGLISQVNLVDETLKIRVTESEPTPEAGWGNSCKSVVLIGHYIIYIDFEIIVIHWILWKNKNCSKTTIKVIFCIYSVALLIQNGPKEVNSSSASLDNYQFPNR